MNEIKLKVEQKEGGLDEFYKTLQNSYDSIGVASYYSLDLSNLDGIEKPSNISAGISRILNYMADNKLVVKELNFTKTSIGPATDDLKKILVGSKGVKPYGKIGNVTFDGSDALDKVNGRKALDDSKLPDSMISVIKSNLAANRKEGELREIYSDSQKEQKGLHKVPLKMVDISLDELDKVSLNSTESDSERGGEGLTSSPQGPYEPEELGLKDEWGALLNDLASDYEAGKFRQEPTTKTSEESSSASNITEALRDQPQAESPSVSPESNTANQKIIDDFALKLNDLGSVPLDVRGMRLQVAKTFLEKHLKAPNIINDDQYNEFNTKLTKLQEQYNEQLSNLRPDIKVKEKQRVQYEQVFQKKEKEGQKTSSSESDQTSEEEVAKTSQTGPKLSNSK